MLKSNICNDCLKTDTADEKRKAASACRGATSPDALMGISGDAARLRSACGQPACCCSFIDSFLRPWILRKQPFSFSKLKKGSCKSTVASFGEFFAWQSSPLQRCSGAAVRRCGQPAQLWWAHAFARRLHRRGPCRIRQPPCLDAMACLGKSNWSFP